MGRHPMGFGADPNPRFLSEKLVGEEALNMGSTAERIHDRFPHLTKERADNYALRSQQKAAAAYDNGKFQPDLIPVATRGENGWGLATRDDGNNVDIDREIGDSAKNSLLFELYAELLSTQISQMKSAIKGQ